MEFGALNARGLGQSAQRGVQPSYLPLHHAADRIRQGVPNLRQWTCQAPGTVLTGNQTSIAEVVEKIANEKRDTLRLFPDRVAETGREAVRRELPFDESSDVLRRKRRQIDLLRQPARLQFQLHFEEWMTGQEQIRRAIGY